jgi:molybdate transport system ATP-binding protein
MEQGRIINSGPIGTMMVNTRLSIAMHEDAGALISARISRHDEQFYLSQLDFSGGKLLVSRIDKPIGTEVKLRIHAKDVSLTQEHPGATSILNILPATITELVPQDKSRVIVCMDVGGVPLLARITQKSVSILALKPGMHIFAQIKSVALHA